MYQSLRVTTEPALEPVTLDLARQHCRIDNEDDDMLLGGLITVARTLAEQHLARALITQGLLWSVADAPLVGNPGGLGLPAPLQVLPLAFSYLTLQRRPLELPRSPVQSVGSVQQVAADGTVSAADPSTYDVLLGSDPARLRLRQALPAGGGYMIGFTAGYGDTGDAVPMPIRHAILFLVAWLYENRGDGDAEMPAVVDRLLAPWRLVTFG